MRPRLVSTLLLLVAAGCAHTRESGGDQARNAGSEQGVRSTARSKQLTPSAGPSHPPLATSPDELLTPEARQRLAQGLAEKGFLQKADERGEALQAAIRKFQESQGLAATGFPDHETVRRLGIDPKKIDTSLESFSDAPGKSEPGEGGSGHDTPPAGDDSGN
jgi:putative peptidoglycan binding protein